MNPDSRPVVTLIAIHFRFLRVCHVLPKSADSFPSPTNRSKRDYSLEAAGSFTCGSSVGYLRFEDLAIARVLALAKIQRTLHSVHTFQCYTIFSLVIAAARVNDARLLELKCDTHTCMCVCTHT